MKNKPLPVIKPVASSTNAEQIEGQKAAAIGVGIVIVISAVGYGDRLRGEAILMLLRA